jgi:hypothetical protein
MDNSPLNLSDKLRSDLECLPQLLHFPLKLLRRPSSSPLFRPRALWLLKVYPRVALWLLRSNLLQKELEFAANLGESLRLHFLQLGCPKEPLEAQLGMILFPDQEPKEIGLQEEDRAEFLKALENL